MNDRAIFLKQHRRLARRYFLQMGAAGAAAWSLLPLLSRAAERSPELARVQNELEPYFTRQDDFRDVSRGNPLPHSLPDEKKREVGLTPETWKLEIVSDADNPADIRNPLSKEFGTALDWQGLMALAEKHAVRFAKVMTCNNIGCPLGMGVWEGVPLREAIWLAQPRRDVRRVFYHGYHNDDPAQIFRSSLPIGRVLEDPFDLPPVILCYKLNGQLLTSQRGGPVRIVVPETYGFKSVKWLSRVTLSNIPHANDTYANQNNDIDSWLKTFSATLFVPQTLKPGEAIPVTGYAQVGISGLSKVQVWVSREDEELPAGDPYFTRAPWTDAEILAPPTQWGGDLPDQEIFKTTLGFDAATGRPRNWPMRLAKAHWAVLLPGLPAGDYVLRSRTIDEKGIAQPMPRPFDKSGRVSIEQVAFEVKA